MAGITVPNPYSGLRVDVQSTEQMGLVEAKESKFSRSALAAGMEKNFMQATKLMDQWRDEADRVNATDKINKLEQKRMDLRDNPQNGYITKLGRNATDPDPEGQRTLTQMVTEDFKSAYDELLKGSSKGVAAKLSAYYESANQRLVDDVNRHIIRQQAVVADSVAQKTTEIAYNKFLYSESKDEQMGALDTLYSSTVENAKRRGVDPDFSKTVGVAVSEKIAIAIDAGAIGEAKELFVAFKGRGMSNKQIAVAKKLIDRAVSEKAANAFADEVMQTYDPTHPNRFGMEKEILEKVGEIKDPVTRKKAGQEVRNRLRMAKEERDLLYKNQEALAWESVRNAEEGQEKFPPTLRSEMEQSGNYEAIKKIDEFLDKQSRTSPNRKSKDDVAAYLYELRRSYPDGFIEVMRTDQYRYDVSERLWQSLLDSASKLSKDRDHDGYKAFHKEVEEHARLNGFNRKKWGKQKEEVMIAADRLYYQAKGQKKDGYITPEDRKKIVKDLFSVTEKNFFRADNYRWEDIIAAGGDVGGSLRWNKSVIQKGSKENQFIEAQFSKIGKTPADASSNQVRILNDYVKSWKFPKELVSSVNKKLTEKNGKAPTEKQINDYILQAVMADKISDK